MKLEELIEKIKNLNEDELLKLTKSSADVYFTFCLNNTNDYEMAKTLFFGSIATIIGIDFIIDEKEYTFFLDLLPTDEVSFTDFKKFVERWTNVKTIEDTDYLIDHYASQLEKISFVTIIIAFSLVDGKLDNNEMKLIGHYLD